MTRKEYFEKERNKFINFCENHNHIYIYGAGRYGKRYFDVMQYNGFVVDGFIITEGEMEEYCERPVYNVKDISALITEKDGIIPAFLGSSPKEIMKSFCLVQPDILSFDHEVILYMENEIYFAPIMEKLKKEFPVPAATKESPWLGWKNLLVIRLDSIGDVICTTAFIRELKHNYPEGTLTVVIKKQNELLLKNCPYIDKLILYESESWGVGLIDECKNFEKIKAKVSEFTSRYFSGVHFDAVFLPKGVLCANNTMEEFLMAFYSKANYRIGRVMDYDNSRAWIYNMVEDSFFSLLYQTKPMHETLYMLDMLRACGLRVENNKLELSLNDIARTEAKNTLQQNNIKEGDKLIAIGLVGSLPVKNWSVGNYNKLIFTFYERYGNHYKFVIFGGKDAIEAASQLTAGTETVINLTGKLPLDMTVACMEQCDLYVGSDTGLMHIATAVDKPSVTLYKELNDSTNMCGHGPCRWGARRKDSIALLPPAGLDGCHVVCQKNYAHCINQITPFQVEQAIEAIMSKKYERGK